MLELTTKNRENKMEPHRDPSTKDEDLLHMKDWLRKQPHLPDDWEDACMLSALRGCSFSLEKCKHKMDMYFTMRTACPELFANRDILRPELMDLMSRSNQCTMPGLTPRGWRVSVTRGLDSALETEHIMDAVKIQLMIADIRMREETEEVAGDVYILDAGVVQPSHVLKLTKAMVKKITISIQEAYPIKIKQFHVLNASTAVDIIYNIMKPFLLEKIKNRIIFHKDYESLYEHIPKDMLPTDYGGTGPSLDEVNKGWIDKLKEYRDWFKEQESLKANEALRPGKPKDYDELFGVEGSFRQLNID